MKNFKQLIIWRKGLEIATQFFRLTETFPKEKNMVFRARLQELPFLFLRILLKEAAVRVKKIITVFYNIHWDLCLNWKTSC